MADNNERRLLWGILFAMAFSFAPSSFVSSVCIFLLDIYEPKFGGRIDNWLFGNHIIAGFTWLVLVVFLLAYPLIVMLAREISYLAYLTTVAVIASSIAIIVTLLGFDIEALVISATLSAFTALFIYSFRKQIKYAKIVIVIIDIYVLWCMIAFGRMYYEFLISN